jgi:hypothetical protein
VAARRPKVPSVIEEEVLFRAEHTCCICRTRGKDVQLHHIDGNHAHHSMSNLAVVCLDCHSLVTGTRGLGKHYSPGEVRKYKFSWDQHVRDSRQVKGPKIRYKKELISQIDLLICQILANRTNIPRVKELLSVLFELHLWRGGPEINSKIIEGFHHLALMSGLEPRGIAALLPERLWELCFHFVGPHEVEMDSTGKREVLRCIEALQTLAEFNCEFGHGKKAVESVTEHAENFFDIGVWYKDKTIVDRVVVMYRKALSVCDADHKAFPYGREALKRSLRRLDKSLSTESKAWAQYRIKVHRMAGKRDHKNGA